MILNKDFCYPPLPTTTHIRVVLLAPGKDDDPIHCSWFTIDLEADDKYTEAFRAAAAKRYKSSGVEINNNNGKIQKEGRFHTFRQYNALSYVWGDQSSTQKIFLNEQPFYIGQNLHLALKRQRAYQHPISPERMDEQVDQEENGEPQYPVVSSARLLWVDAICINQSDVTEREEQVKMMARIYLQADHVYADLGHPGTDKGMAGFMDLLRSIQRAGKMCDDYRSSLTAEQTVAEDASLLEETRSIFYENWPAVESQSKTKPLRLSPQLNKAKDMVLEDCQIPPPDAAVWNYWRRLVYSPYFTRLWIIQEYGLAKGLSFRFGDLFIHPTLILTCVSSLMRYSINRSYYLSLSDSEAGSGLTNLIELASQRRRAHTQNTSESRKSRSLLNRLMFSRNTQATDPRDKIYGMLGLASDRWIFDSLVSYSNSTQRVYQDFARKFIAIGQGIEMLYQVDSGESKVGQPSWVPDWSRNSTESSIYYLQTKNRRYAASQFVPPALRVDECHSTLMANGGIFDSIVHLSDVLRHKSKVMSLPDFCGFMQEGVVIAHRLANQPAGYPTREPTDDVVQWTLVCDRAGSRTAAEIARLRQGFSAIFGCMASALASLEDGVDGVREAESGWMPHMREILQEGSPNVWGRRWCLTKNGYFGLVPGGTRIGDQICLLYGGALPFIIRGFTTTPEPKFQLIGHGYFHGLMHGEVFDLRTFRAQWISLV